MCLICCIAVPETVPIRLLLQRPFSCHNEGLKPDAHAHYRIINQANLKSFYQTFMLLHNIVVATRFHLQTPVSVIASNFNISYHLAGQPWFRLPALVSRHSPFVSTYEYTYFLNYFTLPFSIAPFYLLEGPIFTFWRKPYQEINFRYPTLLFFAITGWLCENFIQM